jgi:pyruvate formate lyase activating enzyme
MSIARAVHDDARAAFDLPPRPPRDGAVRCKECGNECSIPEGSAGFCGLRTARSGKLVSMAGTRGAGLVQWYHDPLPTNCVASWVCPAGADVGYPEASYSQGPEYGWKNLAVFYESCTFDCLFCQNWHFRSSRPATGRTRSAEEIASTVDDRTSCICYFGGDPSSQMQHALAASRIARERVGDRVLRICWETNGNMQHRHLAKALDLSIESGGCVKFDLKCWTESLHEALTGIGNEVTLDNFEFAAALAHKRPEIPLVVASTLLVPGYVGADEVGKLSRFVASLDPSIPYSLLAFHPNFVMHDLPTTSRREAKEALEAAQGAGLRNVRVGNIHLLS